MGWGNGMAIGWPNASAYAGPVVTQESYIIYNCPGEEILVTNPYPVGSFQPGYRIQIIEGSYGYIDSITTPTEGGYSIAGFPIGWVDYQCNDTDVELSWNILEEQPGDFTCFLYAQKTGGPENINASSNPLTVYIYYDYVFDRDDSPTLNKEGTLQIQVPSYSIDYSINQIGVQFAFSVPPGYYISDNYSQIVGMYIENHYNSFINGGDIDNRWVTQYGNVWTFYGYGIG